MAVYNLLSLFCPLLWILGMFTGVFTFAVAFSYVWYQYHRRLLLQASPHPADTARSGPDVIIVGGGVIGSALAAVLARDGRSVTVIERSMATPDTISGEGLLPIGRRALEQLGLSDCLEGIDSQTFRTMVFQSGQDGSLEMPLKDVGSAAVHGRLVDNLRAIAATEDNCVFIEGTVSRLIEEEGVICGVQYRLKGEDELKILRAPLTVVADGRFSKFRSVNVINKPTDAGTCMGIEAEGRIPEIITIFIRKSSILHYALTSTTVRYLIWTKDRAIGDKREFLTKLGLTLPAEQRDLWTQAVATSRIRQMPEYQLSPILRYKPGVMTLGDALSIRHALPAGGMSVGFNDVLLWRELLRKVTCLGDYQALRAAQNVLALERKLRFSLSLDLYSLMLGKWFIPESEAASRMAKAFIECIKHGGHGDSAVAKQRRDPRPLPILHLLCVVIFLAVKQAIQEESWRGLPRGLYRATNIIYTALTMFLPFLWSEWRSLFVF